MANKIKRVLLKDTRYNGVEHNAGETLEFEEDLKRPWMDVGIIDYEEPVTLPADKTKTIFDHIEERLEEKQVEKAEHRAEVMETLAEETSDEDEDEDEDEDASDDDASDAK
jgi:hypothetical protein